MVVISVSRRTTLLDDILLSYCALPVRLANLYANGCDRTGFYLSLLWQSLEWLPPAMLFSGTRYLFLGLTVLVCRKLHRFGVPVSLHLIEGIAHYQYFNNLVADESQDTFVEMTIFFNENLSE